MLAYVQRAWEAREAWPARWLASLLACHRLGWLTIPKISINQVDLPRAVNQIKYM